MFFRILVLNLAAFLSLQTFAAEKKHTFAQAEERFAKDYVLYARAKPTTKGYSDADVETLKESMTEVLKSELFAAKSPKDCAQLNVLIQQNLIRDSLEYALKSQRLNFVSILVRCVHSPNRGGPEF